MKKLMCLVITCALVLPLCAWRGKPAEAEPAEAKPAAVQETEKGEPAATAEPSSWSRKGFYVDEAGSMLSVTLMEDVDDPGWYVGFMDATDGRDASFGGILAVEGNVLKGSLPSADEAPAITVTVSEDGENGLRLDVEGGKTFLFAPMELREVTISVSAVTEGMGSIGYAEGETAPEFDRDYPFQSLYINLAEPAVHTFAAWPDEGSVFVKWMKNGEDFSTEPQFTVNLDESAEFTAVFEESSDRQNPVMNFIGDYQCGRAHAMVECADNANGALITVKWGSSAWETARWVIRGSLDTDTLTVAYSGCTKSVLTYSDSGDLVSEAVEYEDGTGTVAFREDGTFVWHDDRSEGGEDMVFEWLPAEGEGAAQLPNPWSSITEEEAQTILPLVFRAPEGAENAQWSVMNAGGNPMVQLTFSLDGDSFTARAQVTNDGDADISGMYFSWNDRLEEKLENWGAGCVCSRHTGENGYADLCSWYDAASGTSFTLCVTAPDLDGFDLLAVAEAMYRR